MKLCLCQIILHHSRLTILTMSSAVQFSHEVYEVVRFPLQNDLSCTIDFCFFSTDTVQSSQCPSGLGRKQPSTPRFDRNSHVISQQPDETRSYRWHRKASANVTTHEPRREKVLRIGKTTEEIAVSGFTMCRKLKIAFIDLDVCSPNPFPPLD